MRDNHWKFPANIEYEYGKEIPGLDTIAEVKKCYEYCKQALKLSLQLYPDGIGKRFRRVGRPFLSRAQIDRDNELHELAVATQL